MLVLKKVTLKEFANEFNTFCESDKRNLLVRGYDNWDKFIVVLELLKRINQKKPIGITLLETYRFEYLKIMFANNKLKKKMIHTNGIGVVNGVKLLFDNYTRSSNYYADNEFAIFYPVQTILYSDHDLTKMSNKVKNLNTKHNIFISNNDYNNLIDKLYDYVDIDETLILDLNEFNRDKYKIIRENAKKDNRELPY